MIPKLDIAIEHLSCAIKLHKDGKYASALHTAGAAEELLGNFLLVEGGAPEIERLKQSGMDWLNLLLNRIDITVSEQNVANIINASKNGIKHMRVAPVKNDIGEVIGYTTSDDVFDHDVKSAADDMIWRAHTNYSRLKALRPNMPLVQAIEDFEAGNS